MIHPISTNFTFSFLTFSLICVINSTLIGTSEATYCGENIINLNGLGKLIIQPDIFLINFVSNGTAKTSQDATKKVTDQVDLIL